MKVTIILVILGVYVVLAFAIARLCAVNADWERIVDFIPRNGVPDVPEPDSQKRGSSPNQFESGEQKT